MTGINFSEIIAAAMTTPVIRTPQPITFIPGVSRPRTKISPTLPTERVKPVETSSNIQETANEELKKPKPCRKRAKPITVQDDANMSQLCNAIVAGAMDKEPAQEYSKLCAEIRRNRKERAQKRQKQLAAAKTSAEKHQIRREIAQSEIKIRSREALMLSGAKIIDTGEEASEDPPVTAVCAEENPYAQQVCIVDGKIVVAQTSSISVATHDATAKKRVVVEETVSRYYNQQQFLKTKNKVSPRWREDEIDLFYQGLAAWGLNFEAIARMIPGKSRFNVKSRYKRELINNPDRVDSAFRSKKTMAISEYSEATGIELEAFLRPLPAECDTVFETCNQLPVEEQVEVLYQPDELDTGYIY